MLTHFAGAVTKRNTRHSERRCEDDSQSQVEIQANIHKIKEEQFQEGFLRELFVRVLGYTTNPSPNYNLTTEPKNELGAKKANGVILLTADDGTQVSHLRSAAGAAGETPAYQSAAGETPAYQQRRQMQTRKRLLDQLMTYRDWLLQITILDPACGSGAFLNAALQFLMAEHKWIDEMEAKITGSAIGFPGVENSIVGCHPLLEHFICKLNIMTVP